MSVPVGFIVLSSLLIFIVMRALRFQSGVRHCKPETTWVTLSLIRVKDPKFADVNPVDLNRSRPLTSCTVTSQNGKTDYNVSVRGDK